MADHPIQKPGHVAHAKRFSCLHLLHLFSFQIRGAGASGTAELTERLTTCHRCSRIVRVLAVLDAVVVLVGASAFTWEFLRTLRTQRYNSLDTTIRSEKERTGGSCVCFWFLHSFRSLARAVVLSRRHYSNSPPTIYNIRKRL